MTKILRRGALILTAVLLVFLLSSYIMFIDEDAWVFNGKLFLNALKNFDFASTYIGTDAMHPGVSILWLSALLQQFFPQLPYIDLRLLHRFVILVTCALFFLVAGNILLKRIKCTRLLISIIYLLLNPSFILTGGLTWLDLVLTSLIILAVSFWIRFLDSKKWTDLLIIGVVVGISGLTKFLGFSLILMILAISLVSVYQKKITLRFAINRVFAAGAIAILVFWLFYPAMWTNPKRALFSRFDPNEGTQTILLTNTGSIYPEFIRQILLLNPLITLGIILIIYSLFTKKDFEAVDLLAIGGLLYFFSLSAVIFTLKDPGRGSTAFLMGFPRYTLPAVLLLAPSVFKSVISEKRIRNLLKFTLVVLLFGWEIYKLPFITNSVDTLLFISH